MRRVVVSGPGVWPETIAQIASGVVRPSDLVTHVFEIDEFAAADQLLVHPDPAVGKVLIAPNGSGESLHGPSSDLESA
jgi:threonine dehydrogenase-like Zn-dependent dehydrogenase